MQQVFANWWSMTSAYLAAPATLFGAFQPPALVPLAGMALLVLGVVLAGRMREKKVLWLLAPALMSALTPIALANAHDILGWLGLGFALAAGAVAVLLWIALIARDARHRLPVWLIGLFILSYLGYCGYLSALLIWGA